MPKLNTDKGFRTALLIGNYLRGQLTEVEKAELDTWIASSEENRKLFIELCSKESLEYQLLNFEQSDRENGWQEVQRKIAAKGAAVKQTKVWKLWLQSAAAILILGLAGWQLWYYVLGKPDRETKLVSRYGTDLLPGSTKAELTLSDGRSIKLNALADTSIIDKGITITSSNGQIVYSKAISSVDAGWNTIHVPSGGEYILVLDDGSKVWLNSASSLHYPVRFTGKERRVELTEGEAYFEVAKNKEKPFIVFANKMQVQAVGTAFNVDSYTKADSSNLTTLAEGKIKVTSRNKTVFVDAGQQVKTDLDMTAVSNGNVESAVAWKNGLFIFDNTPLPAVMERLARWYDVKILYDKTFKDQKYFTGEIKRNVPVSKLLLMMEMTGIARFSIANNTLTVLPYTP